VDNNRNVSVCTTDTHGQDTDNNKHKENRDVDKGNIRHHDAGKDRKESEDNKSKASTCSTGMQHDEEAKHSKRIVRAFYPLDSRHALLVLSKGQMKEIKLLREVESGYQQLNSAGVNGFCIVGCRRMKL
jgi:hypothetical protein